MVGRVRADVRRPSVAASAIVPADGGTSDMTRAQGEWA